MAPLGTRSCRATSAPRAASLSLQASVFKRAAEQTIADLELDPYIPTEMASASDGAPTASQAVSRGDVGSVTFSRHLKDAAKSAVRAVGESAIKHFKSQSYPRGSRGAKRPRQRAMYAKLTAAQKEEIRFAKEAYRLELDLEYIGIADCPVRLSSDSTVSMKKRIQTFWRDVRAYTAETDRGCPDQPSARGHHLTHCVEINTETDQVRDETDHHFFTDPDPYGVETDADAANELPCGQSYLDELDAGQKKSM